MKKEEKTNGKNNLPIILLVILVLFGLFNIIQLSSTNSTISKQISIQIENAKPAQISLTIININKDDCPKCVDITKIVKLVTDSQKTNVTSFTNKNLMDSDIQDKIKKLGITKFPALIIEGNINQSGFLVKNLKDISTKVNDEIYVFTPIEAPYLNNDNKLVGGVDLIALYNKDCVDCVDVNLLIGGMNNTPIQITTITKVEINSLEGKDLISKYNINKVPTLLFSKELKGYNSITSNWEKSIGSVENDGTYVLRSINPLYYSINESRVVGKIKVSILSDNNCKNCFNGSEIYPAILGKLQIGNFDTNIIDASSTEGTSLITKYKLEKFPTMIIEGDTNAYPNLKQVWNQVGTIEDNKYIFRNVELLGVPYFDVNGGEITPQVN